MRSITSTTGKSGFQAILLPGNCDAFTQAFGQLPFGLIPLCGRTILDWTLDWLLRTEVRQILILSNSADSNALSSHIQRHWAAARGVEIRVVSANANLSNFGDAMRELDNRQLVEAEFLVANIGSMTCSSLSEVWKSHSATRKRDKNMLMTLVLAQFPADVPQRSSDNQLACCVDESNNNLTHYQLFRSNVTPTLSAVKCQDLAQLRTDLLDCHLAFCSAQVAALFNDNFDFQQPWHLFNEIIHNHDIMGFTVHAHILQRLYANCVADWHSYLQVTVDLLKHWLHPLLPELHQPDSANLLSVRASVKSRGSLVCGQCTLEPGVVLQNCFVGRGCRIGADSKLTNCVLLDGAQVASGCSLQSSVLLPEATIGQRYLVGPRCVLGAGAKLADGATMAAGTFLPGSTIKPAVAIDWPEWTPAFADWQLRTEGQEDESSSESSEGGINQEQLDQLLDEIESPEQENLRNFVEELNELLERALVDELKPEHLVLELNGLKHAYDIVITDLQCEVFGALLRLAFGCSNSDTTTSAQQLLLRLKQLLVRFKPLLLNYIKDDAAQLRCLQRLFDDASANARLLNMLAKTLEAFYDCDILSEENIIAWFDALDDQRSVGVKQKVEPFVRWLREAEEE